MKRAKKPSNQELRTRKDLLLAAGRLMKKGLAPTMDDVAAEAMVSRATAYRYFRRVEDLLVEVPIDEAVLGPEQVFAGSTSTDPEERIDQAESTMHKATYGNEGQLRVMLANCLTRSDKGDLPSRQNRRTPLIEAALAPARGRFSESSYQNLCAALAILFGPEAMIVCRDVLRIDEASARAAKSWAARALVRAALEPEPKRQSRR